MSYLDPSIAGGDSVITGVFIQTKYQRWKLEQFHDLIGFDHKKSGVCTFGWNLCTPTIIDQEGHLRTTAYVFLCTEEHASNRWTVGRLKHTCPDMHSGTQVLLTDGFFLPSQELGQLLPAAKRIECKKHIVSVDCPKHCPKSEQADMNRIMWDILGSETTELRDGGIEQLKLHCPSFYSQYFVPELLPKLENICFCDNKHVFTNGTTANSYTESMNSSMGRWFVSASDSIVDLLSQCLQKDAQNVKEEEQALGVVELNTNGLATDSLWAKACRRIFSDFITKKFEHQIQDSMNYHAFVSKNSAQLLERIPGEQVQIQVIVKRNIITEAQRHVLVDIKDDGTLQQIHPCPCSMHLNEGLPCRHIMAVVTLLTAQLAMHVDFGNLQIFFLPRFKRQVRLFSKVCPKLSTTCTTVPELNGAIAIVPARAPHSTDSDHEAECATENAEFEHTQPESSQLQPHPTQTAKPKRANITFDMLRKEAVELCAIGKQNQHAAEFVLKVLRNAKVQLLAMPDVTAPISVQSLRRTCGESAPDIYSTRPTSSTPPISTSSQRMAVVPTDRHRKYAFVKQNFFCEPGSLF